MEKAAVNSAAGRYGLAVVLCGLALVLTLLLEPVMARSIFLLFITAIIVSAMYGGLGPGLVAVCLSTAASGLLFLPPRLSLLVGLQDLLYLAEFLLVMIPISWLAARRRRAEEEVRRLNDQLERRVKQRTSQLEEANRELESFSYSVSHDLRAPLRHIGAFAQMLKDSADLQLAEADRYFLEAILESTKQGTRMIDDLLSFSRMGRARMHEETVDMNGLVAQTLEEATLVTQERQIVWDVADLPEVRGDPSMLKLVWQNLLSNALKFTATRQRTHIEVGAADEDEEVVYFVRDNGVGFDPQYADELFGVFQRLHRPEEFEGTGIGLATVRRIVNRHGGRVWAEGRPGEGATFYFAFART